MGINPTPTGGTPLALSQSALAGFLFSRKGAKDAKKWSQPPVFVIETPMLKDSVVPVFVIYDFVTRGASPPTRSSLGGTNILTHTETQRHRVSETDTLLYIDFTETASP